MRFRKYILLLVFSFVLSGYTVYFEPQTCFDITSGSMMSFGIAIQDDNQQRVPGKFQIGYFFSDYELNDILRFHIDTKTFEVPPNIDYNIVLDFGQNPTYAYVYSSQPCAVFDTFFRENLSRFYVENDLNDSSSMTAVYIFFVILVVFLLVAGMFL